MAAKVQLNNFRFSIYIDAGGAVTFTDLPAELREIAETLDPAARWGTASPISPHLEGIVSAQDSTPHRPPPGELVEGEGRD
jgi:hypothetical protein